MRVVLTTLSVSNAGTHSNTEVGLASIATVLRANGHEVLVLRCEGGRPTDEDELVRFRPELFGVGVYMMTKERTVELCRHVKTLIPGIRICAGGYFPSYYAAEFLEETDCIDFVVRGEGELVLLETLENLQSLDKVKGITFRRGGEIVSNPAADPIRDLNVLPFPDDETIYGDPNLDVVHVSGSRGCMSNCSFCVSRRFNRRWRGIEPEKILDGMASIYHRYDKRVFTFTDNSFEDSLERDFRAERETALGTRANKGLPLAPVDLHEQGRRRNPQGRMRAFAEGLLARELKLNYYIQIKATFPRIADDDLMRLLLESGLTNVYLGIESGNEHDLVLYEKGCTRAENDRAMEFFAPYGIFPSMGFISFNPYSTFERLRSNLDWLRKHRRCFDLTFINRIILYRGLRITEKVERDGLHRPGDGPCDPHGYEFVDERVGRLSNFLRAQFAVLRQEPVFNWMGFLFIIYRSKLHYYRRELPRPPAALASGLDEMEVRLADTMYRLSEHNAEMFQRLLDLAEVGWDESEARRIVEQNFDLPSLAQRLDAIYDAKFRLDELLVQSGFHPGILN
jgi:radical SAM superfamily enzyme YgiQ (UPF0313 family)